MQDYDHTLYLTAEEAAEALGVRVASLYAYVSRQKIRSVPVRGSKHRLYWRDDIERLRAGDAQPGDALAAPADIAPQTGLATETALAFISHDGPFYRGQSAIELSNTATIEEVAALLWDADRRDIFTSAMPRIPANYVKARASLSSLGVIEQAVALLMLVDSVNPRSHDFSEPGYRRTAADVLRWFAAILVGADAPSDRPVHEFVAAQLGRPELADLVRRLMVLGAAHELDPSTYAVRAAANAGVTPYYAVIAGIVAYRGHRLPMSRAEPLASLLEEVVTSSDPRGVVGRRFRNGDRFVGFGSPMYGAVDPRAEAIFPEIAAHLGADREYRAFWEACAEIEDLTGKRPGLTVAAAYLGRLLGFTGAQQISCLLLGRSVGWIANAMEQYFSSDLVRPRGAYVGILPGPGPTRPPAP